jgi:hypothetical protein
VSGLYLLLAVLAVVGRDATEAALRESDTVLTDAELSAAVEGLVTISVMIGGMVGSLGVIAALNLVQGRRWARIIGTIGLAMALIVSLLGLLGGGLSSVFHLIVVITGAATIWLMFRRPSTEYFAGAGRAA